MISLKIEMTYFLCGKNSGTYLAAPQSDLEIKASEK